MTESSLLPRRTLRPALAALPAAVTAVADALVARLRTSSAPAVSPSDSSRSASRRPASSVEAVAVLDQIVEALLEQHAAAHAVAGREKDVRQSDAGTAAICRLHRIEQLERPRRRPCRLGMTVEPDQSAGLLDREPCVVAFPELVPEQFPPAREQHESLLELPGFDLRIRRQVVGHRDVGVVLGPLQDRERAPGITSRKRRFAAHRMQPRLRPENARGGHRIGAVLCDSNHLCERPLGLAERAHVDEGVREQHREPKVLERGACLDRLRAGPFEQRDRRFHRSRDRICTTEGVDGAGVGQGAPVARCESLLEQFDRLLDLLRAKCDLAETRQRGRARRITRLQMGAVETLGLVDLAEPKCDLRLDQLDRLERFGLHPRREPLARDFDAQRELIDHLERRHPGAGLDPGD